AVVLQRELESFPTRRSSDLGERGEGVNLLNQGILPLRTRRNLRIFDFDFNESPCENWHSRLTLRQIVPEIGSNHAAGRQRHPLRSEEHTSELQSRENLVCRL